jgi:hypothetical protein
LVTFFPAFWWGGYRSFATLAIANGEVRQGWDVFYSFFSVLVLVQTVLESVLTWPNLRPKKGLGDVKTLSKK